MLTYAGVTGCFVGTEESVASSRALFHDYKAKVSKTLEFKSKVPDAGRHACPDAGRHACPDAGRHACPDEGGGHV